MTIDDCNWVMVMMASWYLMGDDCDCYEGDDGGGDDDK